MADTETDREETRRWAEVLKAQGWGSYRAAFTHGRKLWDQALAAFEQSEALFRDLGEKEGLIGVLSGRATVLRSSGDPESIRRSVALYHEEIDLIRESGREEELPGALVNLGLAYRDLATVTPEAAAEMAKGIEACREALEKAKRADRPDEAALATCTLADLSLLLAGLDRPEYRERHLKEAMGFYGQAEKLWEERDEDGRTMARLGLAEAYIALGRNLEGARDLLEEVLRYYETYAGGPVSGPVRYQIAQVKALEARLLEAEGNPEEAARIRQEARDHLEVLGFPPK
jgi:tetratricopeptide (TPR) repeat protein